MIAHLLGCVDPDVHVAKGITRNLWSCRNCHSEVWSPAKGIL